MIFNNPLLKITYPLHPLYGQWVRVVSQSEKLEPFYICLIDCKHRLTIPKWMMDNSAESISITQVPIIDPLCLLKAVPIINQSLQSFQIPNTFDQKELHTEVEHGQPAEQSPISQTRSVEKHDSASKKQNHQNYCKNAVENKSSRTQGG